VARSSTRSLAVVAGYALFGGIYAVGALLPFWFLTSPEGGAAFFPSAGLTLGVLVLTSRRRWPYLLLTAGAAEMLVDLTHGQSLVMSFGFALANTAEPLVGASSLRWAVERLRAPMERLVAYIVCAVVGGPLVGAAIAATTVMAFGSGSGWASLFGTWWLGDALGVLVVGTAILAWGRPREPFERQMAVGELAAIVTLAGALAIVPAVLWDHPMLYAVLPVLMWAALRGGVRAVSIAGVAVAFTADWAAVTGRAGQLLASAGTDEQLVFVQIFLGLTLLAALTLAVEVTERRRLERLAVESEAARSRTERVAMEAVASERRHIARETHDIAGHALNVMLLQAGAARRVIHENPRQALELLEAIEDAGRAAFHDLDVALALGDWATDRLPRRGIADLEELVEVWRQAGMAVSLDVDGEARRISTLVDWSAYRIVQEALTNAAKYAPGGAVHVAMRFEPDTLHVSVVDEGASGHPVRGRGGERGLIGMRERVAILSGHLEAGPDGGGFAVRACLPAPSVPA
jgi:signal transduction histidine kinase